MSASDDQTIRLWDMERPDAEPKVLRGHSFDISSIAVSSDGSRLASGSWDNSIRLWDLAQPATVSRSTPEGHRDKVLTVAFSPNVKNNELLLASGSRDKTARLWSLNQHDMLPKLVLTFAGHQDRVTSVAFRSDGKVLATGSADGTISLWDVSRDGTFLRVLRYSSNDIVKDKQNKIKNEVASLAFSPDDRCLAAGNVNGTVIVWDLNYLNQAVIDSTTDIPHTVIGRHSEAVTSVAFHPRKNGSSGLSMLNCPRTT